MRPSTSLNSSGNSTNCPTYGHLYQLAKDAEGQHYILCARCNERWPFYLPETIQSMLAAIKFTRSVMIANHDDIELSEQLALEKLDEAIALDEKVDA